MFSEPTERVDAFDDLFTDSYTHTDPLSGVDPSFVFDFNAYDDLDDGQRWSTWMSVEPLQRGPEPRPDWIVTSQGAVDTDLGILKTGKEADVFLLERADPLDPTTAWSMAAKRYRAPEHRTFHRSASYTEGRSMKRSRDERALKRKSTSAARSRPASGPSPSGARSCGLEPRPPGPLPGPDRRHRDPDGVDHLRRRDRTPARPDPAGPELLASYFDQVRDALATMVQAGLVHGDLSAYNILAAGPRLVIIDLPQIVDLVGNANGMDFLLRDCANICGWFRGKGSRSTSRSSSAS